MGGLNKMALTKLRDRESYDKEPNTQIWERDVVPGSGEGSFTIYKKDKSVEINGSSYNITSKVTLKRLINDLKIALKKFN